MVEDREIEVSLLELDLTPGDGHEHGVEMLGRKPRQDLIGPRRGAGGGVGELAAENEEGLAVEEELRCGGTPVLEPRRLARAAVAMSARCSIPPKEPQRGAQGTRPACKASSAE